MRKEIRVSAAPSIAPAVVNPDGSACDGGWLSCRVVWGQVRKGYVPPDEQKRYESKGTKWRESRVPGMVPGMDPDDAPGAKAAPKSKNQRRNENRRNRKENGEDAGDAEVAAAATAMAGSSLSDAPAAAAAPAEVDPKEALEKKIRNLRKKVRQTDELKAKVDAGEARTRATPPLILAGTPAVCRKVFFLSIEKVYPDKARHRSRAERARVVSR